MTKTSLCVVELQRMQICIVAVAVVDVDAELFLVLQFNPHCVDWAIEGHNIQHLILNKYILYCGL